MCQLHAVYVAASLADLQLETIELLSNGAMILEGTLAAKAVEVFVSPRHEFLLRGSPSERRRLRKRDLELLSKSFDRKLALRPHNLDAWRVARDAISDALSPPRFR